MDCVVVLLALIAACNREIQIAHPRADLPIRELVWSTLASAPHLDLVVAACFLHRDDGNAADPLNPVTRSPCAEVV
jgi:hypothetical protein